MWKRDVCRAEKQQAEACGELNFKYTAHKSMTLEDFKDPPAGYQVKNNS